MGRLRIIAGEFKGRRIAVIDEAGLRPTAERVREALFSILGGRVSGAYVLDAYAGSGALGFESLSRGARRVVFVEASRDAVRGLEAARIALGCRERTSVFHGDLVRLLDQGALAGPFDLVLADPPYSSGERTRFLDAVSSRMPLAPGGLLVLESDSGESAGEPDSPGLRHLRRSTYGRSALDFFEPAGSG